MTDQHPPSERQEPQRRSRTRTILVVVAAVVAVGVVGQVLGLGSDDGQDAPEPAEASEQDTADEAQDTDESGDDDTPPDDEEDTTEGEAEQDYLDALYEQAREVGSGIHGYGDEKNLDLARQACDAIAAGSAPTDVVQELEQDPSRGVPEVAHHIVGLSQLHLCPDA